MFQAASLGSTTFPQTLMPVEIHEIWNSFRQIWVFERIRYVGVWSCPENLEAEPVKFGWFFAPPSCDSFGNRPDVLGLRSCQRHAFDCEYVPGIGFEFQGGAPVGLNPILASVKPCRMEGLERVSGAEGEV